MNRYRIDNWSEYNRSLVQRGSLTIWLEDSSLLRWCSSRRKKGLGRPEVYSDTAIELLLVLREIYSLPLRALEGFARSIFRLMGLDLPVPSYTQICRRSKKLGKLLRRPPKSGPIHIAVDSTGLKVYGEGEWKVRAHGPGKRRTWKKLHIGIDIETQDIVMCDLTDRDGGDAETAVELLRGFEGKVATVFGDGAYDASALRELCESLGTDLICPPPRNAAYKGAESGWERERDSAIAEIVGLGGDDEARRIWKILVGYHDRSLVETAMYRIKQILGGKLRSRCAENQRAEAQIKCLIINKLNALGLPRGEWVEEAA